MSLDEVIKLGQVAQLLIVPLALWCANVGLKLIRTLDKVEAFMEESRADRRAIHQKLESIERPLIANGTIK